MQSFSEPKPTLQQLSTILGQTLSDEDFYRCLEQINSLNPKMGKFWQSKNAEPGLYIVMSGKVRLLDEFGELIGTQSAGNSFGESTMFLEANLPPYEARAGANLHLVFLPSERLLLLMNRHPQIRDRLLAKVKGL
jgi:signal-transduction protein with cAMP-binding, CBS, and nucleotidyltransferase domain